MTKARTKNSQTALQQVRRLKAKPFFPTVDEGGVNHGERELARTLFTYSESDEHMRRVIDQAVIRSFGPDGQDRCPSTSDIWALCREVAPVAPVAELNINPDCELCEGYGFQIKIGPCGISGASRCPNRCTPRSGSDLRIPPGAVIEHYKREQEAAEQRRSMASSPQRGRVIPMRHITEVRA